MRGKKVSDIKRIWELDAFRGLCILGVVAVHVIFDIQELFGTLQNMPGWFDFIQHYGGILFVVLSGICITLGHRNIMRGLVVAGGAAIISLVTCLLFSKRLWILFGVLHLLAFCMLTYGLYKKLPLWLTAALGLAVIGLGFWFESFYIDAEWLFPLGLITRSFSAGDFFPICPNLGYFMLGTVIGRSVYKNKKTLFPKVPEECFIIRVFSFLGRHSLIIYLAHQPVAYGICFIISRLI